MLYEVITKLTYLGIALRLLLKGETVSCQITFEDGAVLKLDHLLFAAVMNHRYEGGGFMFAPDADYADGYLNLCAAHNLTFSRALRILPTAFDGKHLHFNEIVITSYSIHYTKLYELLMSVLLLSKAYPSLFWMD